MILEDIIFSRFTGILILEDIVFQKFIA
ncbi:uncharacterized protein METZ01_LOCUS414230, partial [marine metagenome]